MSISLDIAAVLPSTAAVIAGVTGFLAAVYQMKVLSKRKEIEKAIASEVATERQILVTGEGNTVYLPAPEQGEKSKEILNFQLALLKEYHQTGLSQSRTSFWFSIIFASLGFSLIALSVVIVMQGSAPTEAQSADTFSLILKPAVTLVAGTIIDAVAGLFFQGFRPA